LEKKKKEPVGVGALFLIGHQGVRTKPSGRVRTKGRRKEHTKMDRHGPNDEHQERKPPKKIEGVYLRYRQQKVVEVGRCEAKKKAKKMELSGSQGTADSYTKLQRSYLPQKTSRETGKGFRDALGREEDEEKCH